MITKFADRLPVMFTALDELEYLWGSFPSAVNDAIDYIVVFFEIADVEAREIYRSWRVVFAPNIPVDDRVFVALSAA